MTTKAKPCLSESRRHTWEWQRNTTVSSMSASARGATVHMSRKGIYRCVTCAATKYGQPQQPAMCWCHTCRPITSGRPEDVRMVLCPTCGNKRCPKANDHRNACSGSNDSGQAGSAYP